MDENLSRLLSDLNAEAPSVRAEFDDLFDPVLNTVPIPFFGNLLNAKVVTVGLNPSDGENTQRPLASISRFSYAL